MTAPNGTLCYTIDPGEKSLYEQEKEKRIKKIAEERKEIEDAFGLCRCSTESGELLRDLFPNGCPKHPRKPRVAPYYRKLLLRAGVLVEVES